MINEIDLKAFEKRVYSQWGEDGITEKLFDLLGTTNKYFVEFGSSGIDAGGGNTAYLRRLGFKGLLMDASEHIKEPQYDVKIHKINAKNIESLFLLYNVPKEFDFLSIDIDGNDFYVWESIKKYSPRVVCIEINGVFPSDCDWVQQYDPNWIWAGNRIFGASYFAMCNLAKVKGYTPVYLTCATEDTCRIVGGREPVNLFLVRNDILNFDFKPINYIVHEINDETAYKSKWVQRLLAMPHTKSIDYLNLR